MELKNIIQQKGADLVRFVDVSTIPEAQELALTNAILFCIGLSKKYILDTIVLNTYDGVVGVKDEFLETEQRVEDLADWLATYIQEKGYDAHSQSEKNNLSMRQGKIGCENNTLSWGMSIIPQKTIARLGGVGFIGKNNLLITEEFGCAFCMCSVLTNAPIVSDQYFLMPSQCGDCQVCKKICTSGAILGRSWSDEKKDEEIVDIHKCCCALKCMIHCPWTLKYAKR